VGIAHRSIRCARPLLTLDCDAHRALCSFSRAYWPADATAVVTTRDIIRSAGPAMVPFSSHIDFWKGAATAGVPPPGSAENRIDSIFVFTDPAGDDWYHDLQVVLDTLVRDGSPVCGGGGGGGSSTRRPKLFISQRDLLWSNGFHTSRLGLGAWVACLEKL